MRLLLFGFMRLLYCIFLILFITVTPRLVYYICTKSRALGFLGPSLVCFFLGIALSFVFSDKAIITDISDWSVKFAIPFMLFSIDISSLKRLAKKSFISFFLICLSVFAVSIVTGILVHPYLEEYTSGVVSSLSGLFIGGLMNMASVGSAADLPTSIFSMLNTSYIVAGTVHLVLTVFILPPVARWWLPKYDRSESNTEISDPTSTGTAMKLIDIYGLRRNLPAFGLAAGIVAFSTLLSYVITGSFEDQVIPMLGITTLSIIGAMLPKIKELNGLYSIGQHFIDMFCLTMGLMISFSGQKSNNPVLYLIIMIVMQLAAALLHIFISKPFSVDADTTVITGAASIFSPSFIPPITHFMKNDDVLPIGLIYSILGFVVANYVGFAVYAVLNMIL